MEMMNAMVEKEIVVRDRSEWMDRLFDLQVRIDALEQKSKESPKLIDKSELYMVSQLYKLITKMINCDQDDNSTEEGVYYRKTTKVVRVYRFIPNYVLNYYNQDRVVAGGLYLEVPVYLIDAEVIKKATKNRYNTVLHPEMFSLPGHNKVNYGTLRYIDSHTYMVMAKGTWLDDWITSPKHYEYVTME